MSKRFIAIAVILIALTLLSLLAIIMLTTASMGIDGEGMYHSDATRLMWTNQFVVTAIAETATAKAYTVTPTLTPPHRDAF